MTTIQVLRIMVQILEYIPNDKLLSLDLTDAMLDAFCNAGLLSEEKRTIVVNTIDNYDDDCILGIKQVIGEERSPWFLRK